MSRAGPRDADTDGFPLSGSHGSTAGSLLILVLTTLDRLEENAIASQEDVARLRVAALEQAARLSQDQDLQARGSALNVLAAEMFNTQMPESQRMRVAATVVSGLHGAEDEVARAILSGLQLSMNKHGTAACGEAVLRLLLLQLASAAQGRSAALSGEMRSALTS